MPKIAIICLMRKGSKRFPDKVMHNFLGMPLYLWTINFFKQFKFPFYFAHDYDDWFIWGDDSIIEIKREKKYAGDRHSTCEEIKTFEIDTDIFILAQVTSPLRSRERVQFAIEDFIKNNYDCGFFAYRMQDGYYWDAAGNNINFSQNERTDNGCTKKVIFKETGAFYIFKKEMLDKKHILDSKNIAIYEDSFNIDIDTEENLRGVECKLK